MTARALLLDCDGVLAEVEDSGHLRAFNRVWAEEGVAWQWSQQDYRAATARTCGGHDRLLRLADSAAFRQQFGPISDDAEWFATTLRWHRRKTEFLGEEIRKHGVTGRPGVRRLATEAVAAGWQVAVVSSGARRTVELITDQVLGRDIAEAAVVVTGEDVSSKKPDPECYVVALDRCGVTADTAVAVEDNASGLAAATGAGIPCLVTVTPSSRDQDLSGALAVLDCLGDPPHQPALHLEDLVRLANSAQTSAAGSRTAVVAR